MSYGADFKESLDRAAALEFDQIFKSQSRPIYHSRNRPIPS